MRMLGACVVAWGLFACGDGGVGLDAGPDDGPVAADLAVSADGDVDLADAPTADGSLAPDLAPLGVSVQVTLDGAPFAGAWIVVHDATGAPLSTSQSSNPVTVVSVPQGGMVTVSEPDGAVGYTLTNLTITDVQPGDLLRVPLYTHTGTGSTTVTLAGVGGANQYEVGTGVNSEYSGGLTGRLATFDSRCVDQGMYDLFLLAIGSGDSKAWGYGRFSTSVSALSSATTPALPSWSTAFTTESVVIDSVPSDLSSVAVEHALSIAGRAPFTIATRSFTSVASQVTYDLKLPTGLAGVLHSRAWAFRGDERLLVSTTVAATDNPGPLSISSSQLPGLTGVTADVTTPARTVVAWTRSGTPVADAAAVWVESAGGKNWLLVVRPDAASVTLPAFPAALASRAPAGDPSAIVGNVVLLDLPGTPSSTTARSDGAAWGSVVWFYDQRLDHSALYTVHAVMRASPSS